MRVPHRERPLVTEAILNVLLVVCAVVMLWTVGNGKRWGWLVGVASEIPWFILAVWVWRSWGVVLLCFLYGGLYGRNYVRWGKK